jgi:hypothetical protein
VNQQFKLGQKVKWTSHAAGFSKEKAGEVAAVVAAGAPPDAQIEELQNSGAVIRAVGYGNARGHESYLVLVGKQLYWPRVAALREAR